MTTIVSEQTTMILKRLPVCATNFPLQHILGTDGTADALGTLLGVHTFLARSTVHSVTRNYNE